MIRAEEVRTRRLVICDEEDRARIVARVDRGTAELRIAIDPDDDRLTGVLLVAGDPDCGPMIGLHLFAGGNEVAFFEAGVGPGRVWETCLSGAGITADE
jgi:hypothetical protein